MKILIVNNTPIPVVAYGGTERVIWWLGKELVRRGHQINYLVPAGSSCPFGKVFLYDPARPLNSQIPDDVDFVHIHFQTKEHIKKPYAITHHGNVHPEKEFNINTIFVSQNHAKRNGATAFVRNAVDPDDYGPVDCERQRKYLLFLGYAKRPEKNLKDCLHIARTTGNVLAVVGGKHKWFKWRPWAKYMGFIGGDEKNQVMRDSKALLFPVRWHEPCSIAILEALYFGCPVIGSTHGCLPELVPKEAGFLSNKRSELVGAVKNLNQFNHRKIHEYACDVFSVKRMTDDYLRYFDKAMSGETMNAVPPVNGGNFSRDALLPFTAD